MRPGARRHPDFHPLCPTWLGAIAVLVASMLALVPFQVRAAGMADYIITVDDELRLDFLDDDAEAQFLKVGSAGLVQLPYLGSLTLAGLPLAEARDLVAKSYVQEEIFLHPSVDLSVVNHRPVSVLGDVQKPGFYDYVPELSVEQAIGLAGGLLRQTDSESQRAMQRIALEGELASVDTALALEELTTLRLKAQLAGRDSIDIPEAFRAGDTVDAEMLDMMVAQEEEIIAEERDFHGSERQLLEQSMQETALQITLTEKQIEAQKEQITSYEGEVQRSSKLVARGLLAEPARAQTLRQMTDERSVLLQLEAALSSRRRELTGLNRELLQLDFQRMQTWRQEIADSHLRAAELRENRKSLLERLALLKGWSLQAEDVEETTKVVTRIRRRGANGTLETRAVDEVDALLPGDVLIVRIDLREPSLAEVSLR